VDFAYSQGRSASPSRDGRGGRLHMGGAVPGGLAQDLRPWDSGLGCACSFPDGAKYFSYLWAGVVFGGGKREWDGAKPWRMWELRRAVEIGWAWPEVCLFLGSRTENSGSVGGEKVIQFGASRKWARETEQGLRSPVISGTRAEENGLTKGKNVRAAGHRLTRTNL
jgi:hypothetical protein